MISLDIFSNTLNMIFIIIGFMQPIALIFSVFCNSSGVSEKEEQEQNFQAAARIISEQSEGN